MNEELTIKKFDSLLKENKITEAKEFIEDELNRAICCGDTSLIITLLNEIIGFYRDLGLYDNSYKLAMSLEKLIKNIDDNNAKFISYINIGNSYRQSKHYDLAHNAFNCCLNINELSLIKEHKALYNNLGLLYQDENNYVEAIKCFNMAIDIVSDDLIKNATTYVNLAECYIALNQYNVALDYLNKATIVFDNNLDDFHIMGYYKTKAKLYYLINDLNLSNEFYIKALCKIDKFVGRGKLYSNTRDEYELVLKKLNKKRTSGLEMSLNYFNDFKSILFKDIEPDTLNNITIGLFGLGSECYLCDDYISEDHDFNPGYVVLVENNVPKSEFLKLSNNYNLLPREYDRFFIRNVLPKHGVFYVDEYLFDFLGIKDINNLTMQNKSLLTNGKIFYLGENSTFYSLRRNTIYNSKNDYLIDASLKALEISQYPYNLKRCSDRVDVDTYALLKNHLIDRLIEYYYIYNHKYLPHDKLELVLMDKNNAIYSFIVNIINDNIEYEKINETIINDLFNNHIIIKKSSAYISDYKDEITKFVKEYLYKQKMVKKIIEIEWDMFSNLNNIGGRADCQNNRAMFNLMRKSQYFAWNCDLINSYYNDLIKAKENNYNLLWIKYAFMEETVDPNHFKLIKDNLPILSLKMINLREAIVSVQLEMLEEYSKDNDISKMRTINTNSDKYNNASYETYLRGELSSYSENTLYLYASYLANLSKENKNIVELTLYYTNLFKM